MQTIIITITCNRCGETTTGPFREKSKRLYYDCPACDRSIRLKRQDRSDGVTELAPSPTGRKNNDRVLVTLWMDRGVKEALMKAPGVFSENCRLILEKAVRT